MNTQDKEKLLDDPKPGEWWFVKVDNCVVPIKVRAINPTTGEYVCQGYNCWGHTICKPQKRGDLVAKLPPTFPRLSKLIGRLRELLLSIRLG